MQLFCPQRQAKATFGLAYTCQTKHSSSHGLHYLAIGASKLPHNGTQSMSVNFTTLFERSKYSGSRRLFGLSENEQEQLMKQHERFVVGVIGLVLDQDPGFRAHFLDRICGLPGLETPDD